MLSVTANQLCGSLMLILSTTGFFAYIVFILVVFRRQKFNQRPYFIIAGWLGVADCITLLVFIGYAAPSIMLNDNLPRHTAFGGVLNIAWFTSLPLILLLAVNRYLCICRTELCKKVYTRTTSMIYCALSWCFGIGYSAASFLDCCPLYFDRTLMTWSWDIKKEGSTILSYGEISLVIIVTLAVFGLNSLVIRLIHKARNSANSTLGSIRENRRFGRERKVFFQFFVTIIWLAIFDIPFITMGYIDDPSPWLGYFVTIAYIINCSINGWVYLILNKTIQKELKIWLSEVCTRYKCTSCLAVYHGNDDGTESSFSHKPTQVNDLNSQTMRQVQTDESFHQV